MLKLRQKKDLPLFDVDHFPGRFQRPSSKENMSPLPSTDNTDEGIPDDGDADLFFWEESSLTSKAQVFTPRTKYSKALAIFKGLANDMSNHGTSTFNSYLNALKKVEPYIRKGKMFRVVASTFTPSPVPDDRAKGKSGPSESTSSSQPSQTPSSSGINFPTKPRVASKGRPTEGREKFKPKNVRFNAKKGQRTKKKMTQNSSSTSSTCSSVELVEEEIRSTQESEEDEEVSNVRPSQADGGICWLPDMNLSAADRAIVTGCEWLTDTIMDAVLKLIPNAADESVAINHAGASDIATHCGYAFLCDGSHWILVSTINRKIQVYDSLNSTLSANFKQQLLAKYSLLANHDGSLTVYMEPCSTQKNMNDCGVYCVAFLAELVNDGNPSEVVFETEGMRDHIVKCLETRSLQVFKRGERSRGRGRKLKQIKIQ